MFRNLLFPLVLIYSFRPPTSGDGLHRNVTYTPCTVTVHGVAYWN